MSRETDKIVLSYGVESTAVPQWLWIHTWIIIGSAIVCTAELVFEYFQRRETSLVGFACQSPWLVLAAMLQWRGVFKQRRTHCLAAAIVQALIAGLVIYGIIANIAEAIRYGWKLTLPEIAIAIAVVLVAGSIFVFAIAMYRWARRLPESS